MIAWYIVHRDRRRSGEDRAETPEIFLVSTRRRRGELKVEKGKEGLEWREDELHDMHVGEATVHHISEEDNCVRTPGLRDTPRLAQIHVDDDPEHGPKGRATLRVRPVVEDLWIGDEEDVSRRISISLMTETVRDMPVDEGEKRSK